MTETIFEALCAFYLILGALVVTARDLPSKLIFKAAPMAIGLPLAFIVFAKLKGWPL